MTQIQSIYILLIGLILILSGCKTEQVSQSNTLTYPEFYRGCNQVKAYLDQNELEIAMKYFDSIAAQVPHVPSQFYYTLAQKAGTAVKCELAVKYLKLAIENGKEYSTNKSNVQKINKCGVALKAVVAMEKEIHDRTFNYNYKAKIDSMFHADKVFRSGDSFENLKMHDSLNKKLLIELYDQYGYPHEKLIGSVSASNARILMLNTDPDKGNDIFLPWFKEAYYKGYISARHYAGFTDRRLTRGIDYTAPYYYEKPSHDYPLMIEVERAEIDRRRDSIGLAPKPRR